MRPWQKTFRAIEVGDGSGGRWAARARMLWQHVQCLLTTKAGLQRVPTVLDRCSVRTCRDWLRS
jgi:hypothetical protein